MQTTNRIFRQQPDYIVAVVRPQESWSPRHPSEIPPRFDVISRHFVASFEEALDDLLRYNKIAMSQSLPEWVVIQCPSGGL